jgi:hypothetical protein
MTMAELISTGALAISVIILSLARYKRAQAQLEWAKRCDPRNQHYRPPLIWRQTR